MVITLAPALSRAMHVACLSHAYVCVVGSQAWTPRVGGAMRVGLEVSRVYSRQSVGPSVRLPCPVRAVMYRDALYWWLGLPFGRESGQRLVTSNPLCGWPPRLALVMTSAAEVG